MGEIVSFPPTGTPPPVTGLPALRPVATAAPVLAGPPPSALPATGGRRGEYALADVARPLGLLHLAPRTIIDHLRVLARHAGMPLPRTPRIVSGALVEGPASICQKSRWDAGAFDAWLDTRGPTTPAPALPVPAPIREEMRRRAAGGAR